MKIKFLIAAFVLFFVAQNLSAQWNIIDNWANYPTNRIEKSSDGLLYAASDLGLFRSADQGLHWNKITTPINGFRQLALKNDTLYVVGWSGYDRLWESKNAGLSWQEIIMPTNVILNENYVSSFEIAGPYLFILANTGILRRDHNGGDWVNIPAPVALDVTDLAVEGNIIWAVQKVDSLYQSSDYGQTWVAKPFYPYFSPFRLAVNGQTIICIDQKDYQISAAAVSYDGGQQWKILSTPEVFENIDFGSGLFFARSVSGKVWSSLDGTNWQPFFPVSSQFSWSAVVEQNGVWVMPSGSGVLRTEDMGGNWIIANSGMGNRPGKVQVRNDFLMADNKQFSIDDGATWTIPTYPEGLFSLLYKFNNQYYAQTDGATGLYQANNNFSKWTKVLPSDSLQLSGAAGLVQMGNTFFATSSETTGIGKVFRSDDGGFHWNQVYQEPMSNTEFSLLRAHGDSMLIGVSDPYGAKVFLKSVNGGITWSSFAKGYLDGSSSFQIASVNGILYTLRNKTNLYPRVIRSLDGGETWQDICQHLFSPAQQSYYGIYDYTVKDSFVFVYTDYYLGDKDRLMVSVSGTDAWSDFSGNLDPTKVDINNLRATNKYLYFTNLLDNSLWQRSMSDVLRNPISGRVWYDLNNNGLQGPTEGAYPNILLETNPGKRLAICNSMGKFTMVDGNIGDTLRPVLPTPNLASDPAYVVINSSFDPITFRIYWNPPVSDLRVSATPLSDFLSGLPVSTVFTLSNVGADTISGTLQVVLDENLELISTTPDSASFNGANLISWQFIDLKPLEQRNFLTRLRVKLLIPSTPIAIVAQASNVGDITPKNNIDTLMRIVLGSFDPNDKQVDRKQIRSDEALEKPELTYTIRFQNTGNYPAFTVRLLDTLSTWLDVSTLKVLAASHPWTANLRENNILEFVFDNINLPDSTMDLAGSQGFIKFSLATKGLIPPDSMIYNQAHIYFDLNEPITTNQAVTRINQLVVKTVEWFNRILPLQVSPNPTDQFLQINLPEAEGPSGMLWIANTYGQIVERQTFKGNPIVQDVRTLPSGTYFIGIKAGTKNYGASFIKM